jgi:hypothetical protein
MNNQNTFERDGVVYEADRYFNGMCDGCAFAGKQNADLCSKIKNPCSGDDRDDGVDIIWRKSSI